MATATLITDETTGLAPVISIPTVASATGTRHYRVDSAFEDDALTADGLPAWGQAWSATIPALVRRGISIVGAAGNWTTVRCDYAVNTRSWPIGAAYGVSWTEIQRNLTSANITHGIGGGRLPWGGISADLMQYRITVHRFYQFPPVPPLILNGAQTTPSDSATPVNNDALALPPQRGGTDPVNIAPGQARYMGFDLQLAGIDLYEVTHELLVASDWNVRFYREDDRGNVVGPMVVEQIYPVMDLMPVVMA